jgi:hypothetical protein
LAGKDKKARKAAQRDEKGRFVKQENGRSSLPGTPFRTTDERAREAGKRSGIARKEKGDLRKLCRMWLDEEVATGKDGEKITGGEMMVRVAVKEIAKGNPRFWELIRDTAGFKPVDKVMMAEVEPAVVAEVEQMVKEAANG